jgi:hypothetical protein
VNVDEGDTGGRVYAAGFDRAAPRRERDEEGRILRGGGREGEGADAGERGGEFGRAGPVVVFADFDGPVVEQVSSGSTTAPPTEPRFVRTETLKRGGVVTAKFAAGVAS